jgi:hypothetical protein
VSLCLLSPRLSAGREIARSLFRRVNFPVPAFRDLPRNCGQIRGFEMPSDSPAGNEAPYIPVYSPEIREFSLRSTETLSTRTPPTATSLRTNCQFSLSRVVARLLPGLFAITGSSEATDGEPARPNSVPTAQFSLGAKLRVRVRGDEGG